MISSFYALLLTQCTYSYHHQISQTVNIIRRHQPHSLRLKTCYVTTSSTLQTLIRSLLSSSLIAQHTNALQNHSRDVDACLDREDAEEESAKAGTIARQPDTAVASSCSGLYLSSITSAASFVPLGTKSRTTQLLSKSRRSLDSWWS